jgi:penicillin-binding protein 1A
VVRGGTGGGAALADRPVAGKTGTSEGGRDLWFIGAIPQLTTGVWLGYDDSRKTRNTSVVATLAWRSFMAPISKELPAQQFPPKPLLTGTYKGDRKPDRKPGSNLLPQPANDGLKQPAANDTGTPTPSETTTPGGTTPSEGSAPAPPTAAPPPPLLPAEPPPLALPPQP